MSITCRQLCSLSISPVTNVLDIDVDPVAQLMIYLIDVSISR
ncbi:MAG: hypothetical protein AAF528_02695 [Cyanobacteria bacterium P01_C01_bin.121]